MASSSNKKLFGYCKVEWQIDNFFLQTMTKEWTIESPEFTIKGSEETIWSMNIRPTLISDCNFILFNLKRSSTDSGPKYIWLNLKVQCICSNVTSVCCKKLLSLKNGSKYEVCLGSMEYFLSEMDRLDYVFTIVCDMIVYNKQAYKEFGECNHLGVRMLSEHMLDLYTSAQNFDTKLVFDDNVILAHRAILCARNTYLSCIIQESDGNSEVEEYTIVNFTNILDYKAMRKVLAYFYTGNIRHVLQEPSFAIHHCAIFLGVQAIKVHYVPDKVILKSSLDFEEYNFVLRGYKFEESRLIWNFDAGEFTNVCRLNFLPDRELEKKYIPLFAKAFEKPVNVCFVLKFSDECDHLCTAYLFIANNAFIDLDKIISGIVKKLHSSNQVFEIVINLKVSTGMKISYVDEHICVSVNSINEDYYYDCLASDMEFLLHHGSSTDLIIVSSDSYFCLHKCILASRSSYFSDIFMKRNEFVIFISIDPYIFYAALMYIYTGFHPILAVYDVIELYKAAVFFNLFQLKSMCTGRLILSSKTDRYIRCRLVRLAEEHEDYVLMKSVLGHLFDKNDIILLSDDQASFQDVDVCWSCS